VETLSSVRSSGSGSDLHVSGDLIAGDMTSIEAALKACFGDEHVRVKSASDVYAATDEVTLNAYLYRAGNRYGKHYLLGGKALVDRPRAVAVMSQFAAALDNAHVVYSIELTDRASPEQPPVTFVHTSFDSVFTP
jgi:hypothetical protein